VINTIAEHGRAVIVGRGANLILPPEKRFSIRVIADRDLRIRNVTRTF
jgi:cytidylate kinase